MSFSALFGQAAEPVPKWPTAAPAADEASFGAHLPRTLNLIATSTKARKNTVRVMFYGQSIASQWTGPVEAALRKMYPNVNFVFSRSAIGGFGTDSIVRTTERDLKTVYPDVMLFHDYSSHPEFYEDIIRQCLANTTTEILITNDHIATDDQLAEERDPANLTQEHNLNEWQNYVFLPDLAKRYGLEFVDVRAAWREYLETQNLKPQALLRDVVHLNPQGIFVITDLISRHFKIQPEAGKKPWRDKVTTYPIGKDLRWKNNRLELDFVGNRVDLIAKAGPRPDGPTQILIDGKKPSELPGAVVYTRTSPYPTLWWPSVIRVDSITPPIIEKWTLNIYENSEDLQTFKFDVKGSVTGPDGSGTSTEKFVSNSGRVVIEPTDWRLVFAHEISKLPMPPGFTVTWKGIPQSIDKYKAPEVKRSDVETVTTIAQGFPNGPHHLTLIAPPRTKAPLLKAIRVYHPELPEGISEKTLPETPIKTGAD